jgi:hypothetical protein
MGMTQGKSVIYLSSGSLAAASASLASVVHETIPCFVGVAVPKHLVETALDLVARVDGAGMIKRRLQQQLQVAIHACVQYSMKNDRNSFHARALHWS